MLVVVVVVFVVVIVVVIPGLLIDIKLCFEL